MEKTVFFGSVQGLMVEQMIRDDEYSMYSRHFHDSYELYFLLEGERYYFIDRETYLVKDGMAVLISRNQIHKTSMAGVSYHDRLLLQLDGDIFAPYVQLMGITSLHEFYQQIHSVVAYRESDWQEILDLLESLKRELFQHREGYQTVVKMLVIRLLIVTIRNQPANETRKLPGNLSYVDGLGAEEELPILGRDTFQAMTPKHRLIREVADYLLNNLVTAKSQEELAARFYVSKSYLCRIFKEVTGFTLNEYQNLAKIRAARKLLVETKLPITEIADRAGYESITYFERVFKKHTGERPLQYRKKFHE